MMVFVDPAGDDSGPGTIDRPFATLDRARQAGTVITLRGGTYRLAAPLSLTAADSGVVYQAHEGEEVVISGGRQVTGWSGGEDGVHTASVPGLATRQLYVSGRRAARASRRLEQLTRIETGYVLAEPQAWRGQMELVYQGVYPWSEARCPVDHVDGATITMAQPAFEWAGRLYRAEIRWEGPGAGLTNGADNPTSIENSPSFVTEGTFALADGVLHYWPRPGEDLGDVVAPVLETLVHGQNVANVVFRGITFADATWLRPSTPQGFLHYHGNSYYDGGEIMTVTFGDGAGQVEVPTDPAMMPGAIRFEDSSGITFEGCRFTRLGGVAVEFRDGIGDVVRDSEISAVAGGGVIIAGARDSRVENTHIHHIGLDYHGSPALLLTGTHNAMVAHNEVNDVPHAGMVVYDSTGVQILHNLVHDTMQVLADGGGIYIAGRQGTSYADGALVRGNVVLDTVTPYNYALYTDYGAAWVTVQGNVIHRNDNSVVLEVSPPLDHVAFIGNYWDGDPGAAPESVMLTDNTVLSADDFTKDPAVKAIVAAAGRR